MKNNNRQILKLLEGREYRQNRRRNRIVISVITMAVCMVFCVFSLAYGKIHSDYLLHIRSAGTAASTTLEYPDDAQYQQIKNLSYIKETGWQKTFGKQRIFTVPCWIIMPGSSCRSRHTQIFMEIIQRGRQRLCCRKGCWSP